MSNAAAALKEPGTDPTIEAERDIDRVQLRKTEIAREEDAKLERRIRMAMAAKEDSEGNCFYCGKPLEVDGDVKLHPMPYLDCKGPMQNERITPSGRIERAPVALPNFKREPIELKPVVRPFGERD